MGLGLSLASDLGRKSFSDVARLARSELRLPAPLDAFATFEEGRDVIYASLFPNEEPVAVMIEGRRLLVEARTSGLGPGYHATLVDCLDRMALLGGLEWRETEDASDETGYFATRDPALLQAEHATFLAALQERVVEISADAPSGRNIQINLDLSRFSLGPEADVHTQRGPRTRDEFAGDSPEAHFPWWTLGLGAPAAASLIETLLWTEFKWRAPLDDRDDVVAAALLRLADIAGDLAPPAMARVRLFLGSDAEALGVDALPPLSDPPMIGYARWPARLQFDRGWSAVLPGHMSALSSDGGKRRGWSAEWGSCGVTVYEGLANDPDPPPAIDEMMPTDNRRRDDDVVLGWSEAGSGPLARSGKIIAYAPGTLLLLSLSMDEDRRGWTEEVAGSVGYVARR